MLCIVVVVVVVFSANFVLLSVFSCFCVLTSVCYHLYIYKLLVAFALSSDVTSYRDLNFLTMPECKIYECIRVVHK